MTGLVLWSAIVTRVLAVAAPADGAPTPALVVAQGPAGAEAPAEPPPRAATAPSASDQASNQEDAATDSMTFTAPTRAAPPPPVRPVTRARTMEEVSGSTVEEMTIRNVRWRYSLNFFGDVTLSAANNAAPNHVLGFAIGAQDFLLKGELGNDFVATTEFGLEPGDGGVDVDIERYNVRWQSDHVFVQTGRTHTAFGYWNNAYHHGRWLQPTIERPRWVAFEDEGGVLPVHWVGINAGANLNLGASRLDVVLSVGNGRGKIVDDVRNSRDYQSLKAFHASVELVGIHWPELRAGVSAVVDRIVGQPDRVALPGENIDEVIGGAHVAYAGLPLILIAESYLVVHKATAQQWTTYGGFALLGYAFGRCTPYVELERFVPRGGPDPFFLPNPGDPTNPSFDTVEGIGGVRIDLSDWTALKAEYRETRLVDRSVSIHEGLLNWSWGF
jgi:hypothetical protein